MAGLISLAIWSCDIAQTKMTVLSYDNQNPASLVTTDTLILDSMINKETARIDIYFCKSNFNIPYYLPTGGIYKDSTKECYTYDANNRVIEMSVDGSGTMGTWHYTYDSLDRISNIEGLGTKYSLDYNESGQLTGLAEDRGSSYKRLEFKYR
jgi:hypothetical protein